MNVIISEINDKELADLLKCSGMNDDEAEAFIERIEHNCCCAEKLKILRKARKKLLDNIHEKQAVLDKLDNLIWCTEHGGGL